MNQKPKINITDSEWEVMRTLWSQQNATSSEIVAILEHKMGWRPTTTKTLLARLVKKNAVGTTKDGNRYIYRALITESASWDNATASLFGHICAQKMGRKIARLIDASTLSHQDIELIEFILSQKKRTAVNTVACDCVSGQCTCEKGTCEVTK